MERIQKALAQARAVRQGHPSTSVDVDMPSRSTGTPAKELRVRYSETRILTPHIQSERLLTADGQHVEENAYKILCTQVLQRLRAQNWNALAIVSANAGEGKTLTAANLALSLAREVSHTVLLVDINLRRPAVHRLFGEDSAPGLTDYLLDDVPLPQLLFNPGIERLVVLPGGRPVDNAAELLASPKLGQLVGELKARYPSRIVLFDTPALLGSADTLAFSPYIDAALLVIQDGKTRREDVERAVALLQHTNLVGSMLNQSPRI